MLQKGIVKPMPSSKDYLNFVLGQLSGLEKVTYRQMMGEFILYYNGKIIGGIYDNRLLLKPFKSAKLLMQNLVYEEPYKGAKKMLLVEDVDNKKLLEHLFNLTYSELYN